MTSFHPIVWLILAGIGAGSVLGSLYALALGFERERAVHDLRIRVAKLRTTYAARVAEMNAREHGVELAEQVRVMPIELSVPRR